MEVKTLKNGIRRFYCKEGHIDIFHCPPGEFPVTGKTVKNIQHSNSTTYVRLEDKDWIEAKFCFRNPVKILQFSDIFTAKELWRKIYDYDL